MVRGDELVSKTVPVNIQETLQKLDILPTTIDLYSCYIKQIV